MSLLRKTISPTLTFLTLAFSATVGYSQVLLSDDFTVSVQSDDVNFEINSSGRQAGSLVGTGINYIQGVGGNMEGSAAYITSGAGNFQTQIGNGGGPLWLVGTNFGTLNGIPATADVSPEFNFNLDPGAGSALSISFDVDPNISGGGASGDWAALSLGASDNASFGTAGTGARGQFINTSAAHFGILFRDNGQFQAFDGSTLLADNLIYSSDPTVVLNHHIVVTIAGVGDSNPWDGIGDAQIDVFADGSSTPFFTFTKTGGYTDNFLTLEGFGSAISAVDNFEVSTVAVPEPSSIAYVGVALGVVGAVWLRRRKVAGNKFDLPGERSI